MWSDLSLWLCVNRFKNRLLVTSQLLRPINGQSTKETYAESSAESSESGLYGQHIKSELFIGPNKFLTSVHEMRFIL